MSNLDWGAFFRNVLGTSRSGSGDGEETASGRNWRLDANASSDEEEQLRNVNAWLSENRDRHQPSSDEEDVNFFNRLTPQSGRRGPEMDEGRQIFIGNLQPGVTEDDLAFFLAQAAGDSDASRQDFEVLRIHPPRPPARTSHAFVRCSTRNIADSLINKSRTMEVHFSGRALRIERRRSFSFISRYARRSRPRQIVRQSSTPQVLPLDAPEPPTLEIVSDSDSENNIENFFTEEFDASLPPPNYLRLLIERPTEPPTQPIEDDEVDGENTEGMTLRLFYAKRRQESLRQLDEMEKELATKLSTAESQLKQIDREKRFKEIRRTHMQKELQSLKMEIAKLEAETASLEADRHLTEDLMEKYVHEHEAKVNDIKEKVRKYRIEKKENPDPTAEDSVNANASSDSLVSSRVSEELDCICCYEKMAAQVYQCSHGHLICHNCHRRLRACPVCREVYTRPIRCRFAESLFELAAKSDVETDAKKSLPTP